MYKDDIFQTEMWRAITDHLGGLTLNFTTKQRGKRGDFKIYPLPPTMQLHCLYFEKGLPLSPPMELPEGKILSQKVTRRAQEGGLAWVGWIALVSPADPAAMSQRHLAVF